MEVSSNESLAFRGSGVSGFRHFHQTGQRGTHQGCRVRRLGFRVLGELDDVASRLARTRTCPTSLPLGRGADFVLASYV